MDSRIDTAPLYRAATIPANESSSRVLWQSAAPRPANSYPEPMKRDSPTAKEFEGSTTASPSDFQGPPLSVTLDSLRAHFQSEVARACAPLRNPHHEPRVSAQQAREARPAAVLIAIVKREPEATLLLTRRHEDISYGGHICFAGGGREPGDTSLEATALRESFEEIASNVRPVSRQAASK